MITTRQFLAIPPIPWKVLCLFLRLVDGQGRCSYSARELAAMLGLARITVHRAIVDLQARGLLSVQLHHGPHCIYQVPLEVIISPEMSASPEIQASVSPEMHASLEIPCDTPANPVSAPENATDPTHLNQTGSVSLEIQPSGKPPMTEQQFLARIAELVALDAATPAPTP